MKEASMDLPSYLKCESLRKRFSMRTSPVNGPSLLSNMNCHFSSENVSYPDEGSFSLSL